MKKRHLLPCSISWRVAVVVKSFDIEATSHIVSRPASTCWSAGSSTTVVPSMPYRSALPTLSWATMTPSLTAIAVALAPFEAGAALSRCHADGGALVAPAPRRSPSARKRPAAA